MKKIAFLFSGQGSQKPGMMRELYKNNIHCRSVFDIADKTLNRSISKLCFDGTQEELNLTYNTQPCMVAVDLAAYYSLTSYDIYPDVIAGFSVGEYAALAAAQSLTDEDTFKIVQLRAKIMQETVPVGYGAMAAVMGLDEANIRELCSQVSGYVEPANMNCPGQVVVSGETSAIDELVSRLRKNKIKIMKLPVSAPFHSKMMETASDILKEKIMTMEIKSSKYPIYMNFDAMPYTSKNEIIDRLVLQAKSPVMWEKTIINMYCSGVDTFVELGCGKTLSTFVKKTLKNVVTLNIENMETLFYAIDKLK